MNARRWDQNFPRFCVIADFSRVVKFASIEAARLTDARLKRYTEPGLHLHELHIDGLYQ